jgi:hypothetical protein
MKSRSLRQRFSLSVLPVSAVADAVAYRSRTMAGGLESV